MNITAFGNDDRLDIGIALDPLAFDEPDLLVDCLPTPSTSYVTAARGRRSRRHPG